MFKTAVILAATEGIRMRPLSLYLPKVLLPVWDRPIIFHHIERFRKIGTEKIIITLEKKRGKVVETAIRCAYPMLSDIVFVEQDRKRGAGMGYALLECLSLVLGSFSLEMTEHFDILNKCKEAIKKATE